MQFCGGKLAIFLCFWCENCAIFQAYIFTELTVCYILGGLGYTFSVVRGIRIAHESFICAIAMNCHTTSYDCFQHPDADLPETLMWAVAAKPGLADAENGGEQIKMEKEANR